MEQGLIMATLALLGTPMAIAVIGCYRCLCPRRKG